ncbi:unnamed protein product, partial [Lampetra planeri]
TGQKKTPEKKDGRRMSFQRPKGTIEYSDVSAGGIAGHIEQHCTQVDTTPNELVQLNKLFSRAVVPGQVLYVPDPEYVSSVGSSPSLSPISPLSPTSSEADLEKVTKVLTPPVFSALRHSRAVSSTSEEEEALTEKFLKINCKYITDGKGAVSGVLLVTPNNIMFDPHRMDPLVQAHGCEEYGIMCPLEEVQSAAIFKEITDPKIRETVPNDLEPLPAERHPSQQKDAEHRLREPGTNDSGSTAPRSTEGSISEDVFTESELSPIREEEQASSEDLCLDKSSGASTESVQTVTQEETPGAQTRGSARSSASHSAEPAAAKACAPAEDNPPDTATENDSQSPHGSPAAHSTSRPGSQSSATPGATDTPSLSASPQGDANQGTELSTTDTMQKGKEENVEQGQTDNTQNSADGKHSFSRESFYKYTPHVVFHPALALQYILQHAKVSVCHSAPDFWCVPVIVRGRLLSRCPRWSAERRKSRSHKFLCLRVGKPMRKTFVSNASASMQQYAQQGKKHEYWFAVPQERSDHLYVFFMQWSPDMYGEGVRGMGQEPGFMVVKKNEASESAEDDPVTDLNVKEWEVVSMTEYHRRIDALNSEDLRSLCKRLQITTKEEVNSKHDTSIKTELEPETFKPQPPRAQRSPGG